MNSQTQFLYTFSILATAIAGFAVLWRNWLADHPTWKTLIQKNLGSFEKILTCGSCFTFWLTLATLITLNPIQPFIQSLFFSTTTSLTQLGTLLISWMALGFCAVLLRFLYVLIQEQVSYLVHQKNNHGH